MNMVETMKKYKKQRALLLTEAEFLELKTILDLKYSGTSEKLRKAIKNCEKVVFNKTKEDKK